MDSASICSSIYDSHTTITSEMDDISHDRFRVRSPQQRLKPSSFCLIGKYEINLKILLEERYNVEIIELDDLNILHTVIGRELYLHKNYAFVVNDFESNDFQQLNVYTQRIFGPTVIRECAKLGDELPLKTRPLYCQSMKDVVVCFAGFKDKPDLTSLVNLVHYMGGSVRKQFTGSVTHIVAKTTQKNDKYRLAIAMGRPVMSDNWIVQCWKLRNSLFTSALSEELMALKLAPFYDLKIVFFGFSPEECIHMQEQAIAYGATVGDCENCTHVVVEGNMLPAGYNDTARHVTAEWFWLSIQLNVCANEDLYQPGSTEGGGRIAQKRLLSPSSAELTKNKNAYLRSSTSDRRLSCSFLDVSGDASSILGERFYSTEDLENYIKSPKRGMSKRQQICVELLQTENNYFQVLHTVMTLFKEQLEKPDQMGVFLLDSTEIRMIFGNIPPIYEIHKKINRELANLIVHWNESHCIGKVWSNHKDDLVKAYPPFVNFFEKTKETLNKCDKDKPRFHAFLKVCQNKAECSRQTLQELLIRPVQRLPSVILLLNDLLKHTDKSNPDHQSVEKAIAVLKSVLTHINDDKRKTEGQVEMFNIVNDIENCPAFLLSSTRQLISSVQVLDLSNSFTDKGVPLTFYLFNDCVEVAKKRQRAIRNESKSPNKKIIMKSRKHINLLFLSQIRRVLDIIGFEVPDNLFCLTLRGELEDKNYPFQIVVEDSNGFDQKNQKMNFLNAVCNQVVCMTGRDGFSVQLYDISCSASKHEETDLSLTISKALKHVKPASHNSSSSSGRRLSRTFSFSKSPAGPLRRAVSQMTVAWTGTLSRMSRSNLRLALQDITEEGNGGGTPTKKFLPQCSQTTDEQCPKLNE